MESLSSLFAVFYALVLFCWIPDSNIQKGANIANNVFRPSSYACVVAAGFALCALITLFRSQKPGCSAFSTSQF